MANQFEQAVKAVKGWFMRAGADTGLAREFKSIFELGGVPAFQQFYNLGIYPWKYLYKGFYSAWHLIDAPTIQNPRAKRRPGPAVRPGAEKTPFAGNQCAQL